MKYYNEATAECYEEGQEITRRIDDYTVFSGTLTAEILTEWGFVEWTDPEPTEEELLERARLEKLAEIDEYNQSNNVNEFTVNGIPMWLTVNERQQISTQIAANGAVGRTVMTKWYGGHSFTFPLTVWEQMLVALEVYAGDALNVTEEHRAAVNSLQTVQEIEAYDITDGYPEKLVF